jgi:hypothetical protein
VRVFYQQIERRPRRGSSLIFPLLLFLISCVHPPRVEEFEAGIGQLTQDELTRRFGYPQRLKRLSNGTESWEYEFLSGQSRCVGYRVYFDAELRSQKWEPIPCR